MGQTKQQARRTGAEALAQFRALGIPMLPTYPKKDEKTGKERPMTPGPWETMEDRKATAAKAAAGHNGKPYERWQYLPIDGGLAIIDIDIKGIINGTTAILALQAKLALLNAPHVLTPSGGVHIICKHSGKYLHQGTIAPGLEIMHGGHIITAAGSKKDGGEYILIGDLADAPELAVYAPELLACIDMEGDKPQYPNWPRVPQEKWKDAYNTRRPIIAGKESFTHIQSAKARVMKYRKEHPDKMKGDDDEMSKVPGPLDREGILPKPKHESEFTLSFMPYMPLPGGIIVVAAPTGYGKTTFMLNMTRELLAANQGVLYISYEEQPSALYTKLTMSETAARAHKETGVMKYAQPGEIRAELTASLDDKNISGLPVQYATAYSNLIYSKSRGSTTAILPANLQAADAYFTELINAGKLDIRMGPGHAVGMPGVPSDIAAIAAKYPQPWVFIDYVQKIPPEAEARSKGYEKFADIATALITIRNMGFNVVVAAQFNREDTVRAQRGIIPYEPAIDHIREAADIGHMADMAIGIGFSRPDGASPYDNITYHIMKHRRAGSYVGYKISSYGDYQMAYAAKPPSYVKWREASVWADTSKSAKPIDWQGSKGGKGGNGDDPPHEEVPWEPPPNTGNDNAGGK